MHSVQLKITSTVDAICNTLSEEIYSLRFPPGSKITENALVSRYGVSRNTVREAIAYLLSNGLLVKIPNKGIYVKEITYDDVREIFHLRGMLELEAVRTIIASGVLSLPLVCLAEKIEKIDPVTSWEEHIDADIRFHEQLVFAAGSPRLSRLYDTIISEVKLCVRQVHNIVPVNPENVSQHRLILEAMENDDEEMAVKLLSKHMEDAISNYEAGFLLHKQSEEGKKE